MAEITVPYKGTRREGAIFTLDLGSKTGWALCQTDGSISSGTVEFKPGRFESSGMALLRFKHWLYEVNSFASPIEGVWFEAVPPQAHLGGIAGQVYGCFMGILTVWAEQNKIPYQGVPIGTIKKHATGKGNASKAEVIDAMRRKGHSPADDNAADALALLHWALERGVAS